MSCKSHQQSHNAVSLQESHICLTAVQNYAILQKKTRIQCVYWTLDKPSVMSPSGLFLNWDFDASLFSWMWVVPS